MAALPTFDTLKTTLLNNTEALGICPGYWDIMRATDYQELIDAGIPWLVYAYRSFILTDALLAEVDEALLNLNGIYTTTATITNPGLEIFVFNNAAVTVNIDDGNRHNINVMGASTAIINVSGNSFAKVQTWGTAGAAITVNDTSVVSLDCRQKSTVSITQTGTAASDIATTDEVTLTLNLAAGTYALVQGFGQSIISKTGAGVIEQRLYELSKNPIPIILT